MQEGLWEQVSLVQALEQEGERVKKEDDGDEWISLKSGRRVAHQIQILFPGLILLHGFMQTHASDITAAGAYPKAKTIS